MSYHSSYYTSKGNNKVVNQDSFLIKEGTREGYSIAFYVVCDGMGGLSSGELASSTTIHYLSQWFDQYVNDWIEKGSQLNLLKNALLAEIEKINHLTVTYGQKRHIQLGTTLTAMFICDETYLIAQIGDSRAYQITPTYNQLTEDQTFVQREIDRGRLTIDQAENHPKRHVLLQCVGAVETIEIAVRSGELNGTESFLICSDGFSNKLNQDDLPLLKQSIYDHESAAKITDELRQRGETDDITFIYVDVNDQGAISC
ncbi:serine/threonine protein phosphatase PrpC [Natronobacillus azotifigens]|uniref:Serine/threonine-protein phosphatase n=1 Tax=Natronobacillus azotifigens TaxID=472978 RepID=A0A9J6RCR2_9BACI|nr:PP2C family serine/threonine-protein phosphatase [Natronobacillus azotifigens]MCZ0703147.1 serine/threonine-protein phosphatase [Natronobacillus azotifigens]